MNAIQFDASTFFFPLSFDIHLWAQNRDRDFFLSRSRFYSVKYADLLVKQERKYLRLFSWADRPNRAERTDESEMHFKR